ncbi:hypothetical protein, partial [Enterobacter mori]
ALPCFRVMATQLPLEELPSTTPVLITGKERSTATGKARSAGGADALPFSPQGKEGWCGCPDAMHRGTNY